MIKVQELPLGIMVTMNNMVYKSPGKGLVVHEEDVSVPLVHPTWGKLHYCLIVFLGQVSIYWSFSKV